MVDIKVHIIGVYVEMITFHSVANVIHLATNVVGIMDASSLMPATLADILILADPHIHHLSRSNPTLLK
jgi:hypothetical protein